MTTSFFDDDSGVSSPQLLEPVERFLRAGRAAVEATATDEDEGAFDVDGLLRRVGFLQDDPAGEEPDGVGAAAGVAEVIPAGPRAGCDDLMGAGPEGERSTRERELVTVAAAGGREDAVRSGDPGPFAGVVAMLVPAIAAGVGGVLAVAGAVLGSEVAVHAAVAAAGAVVGALLTLAVQRRRAASWDAPGGNGDAPGGNGASRQPSSTPAVLVQSPADTTDVVATDVVDSGASLDSSTDVAALTSYERMVLTDPVEDHTGDFFEPIYQELKGKFEFDPAAEDTGADLFGPLPGAGRALTMAKRFARSDVGSCLPSLTLPVMSPVPNLVADEVEAFLSSSAADSLWLEQVADESRQALQLRSQWAVSAPRLDRPARSGGCSVQHLILTQIKMLVQESFHCSAQVKSGYYLVILFDADKVRDAVPHFSGRKPCAERLMLWADREQWAVARQSRSGSMSVVTHLSALQGGAAVLEELLQTYSELVVSPDAAVLC